MTDLKGGFCFEPVVTSCRAPACENIKLVLVSIFVTLMIAVIITCVTLGYSVLKVFPLVNFLLIVLCLVLLAYVEALHYACVAVEKWDMEPYEQEYPKAVRSWRLVNTPEKVKKFLMGRQFFVIFVVFLIAQNTTYPGIPKNFAGLPQWMVLIFIQTGLPGVCLILTIGQLISQIFIEEYTVHMFNYYGVEFIIRLSLFVEWIGVTHTSWVLYHLSSRLFCGSVRKAQKVIDLEGKSNQDNTEDEAISPTEQIRGSDHVSDFDSQGFTAWDIPKFIASLSAVLFSIAVTCVGMATEKYVLPVGAAGAFILANITLGILFYLEGLMIAIVATQYWDPEQFKEDYPRAYKMHKLVNQPENVKRFIIGRQFFTVGTNVLLAQVFVFHTWNAPDNVNKVIWFIGIKSGLVGVLIILNFVQLCPEMLAAEYPLCFMDMYFSNTIVNMSLFFDMCGVGHAAWAIYYATRNLCCDTSKSAVVEKKPEIIQVNSAEIAAANAKLSRR